MKTRTHLHAGANGLAIPDPLTACKKQKQYWINQYNHMQNVLANCGSSIPPSPKPVPNPGAGGGWIGGTWYPDRSGICG